MSLDLSELLGEKEEKRRLPDLDWLEVDRDTYREFEDLPEQNIHALPDLAEAWKDRDEAEKFSLVGDNERHDRETPFWSERPQHTGMSEEEKRKVKDIARREIIEKEELSEVQNSLKKKFSKEQLSHAKEQLKKAFREEGLLGNVYVDASLFDECYEGEGKMMVRKNADTAKYVVGKEECHDCVHNNHGVCAVFDKEITFDLQGEIDQDLWEEYKDYYESRNIDLSGIDKNASPKEKLRQAWKADEIDRPARTSDKPVQPDPTDRVTREEAEKIVARMEGPSKEAVQENTQQRRKRSKVARLLMAMDQDRLIPSNIEDRIAHDPDLAELKGREHLLGSLYLDLSYFSDIKQASNFFDEHDIDVKNYLVVGSPSASDDVAFADAKELDFQTPETLNRILKRYAYVTFGNDVSDRVSTLKKTAEKLEGMEEKEVRRFANNVFSEPLPEKHETYHRMTPEIWRESGETVSLKEARQQLASFERDLPDVEDPNTRITRKKMAKEMMAGNHGASVEARLADGSLSDMKKHHHLLGRLYRDDRMFDSESDKESFYDRHSSIKNLPQYEETDDFWQRKDVLSRIASRTTKVHGDLGSEEVQNKLKGASPEKVRSFARRVFSTPIPEEDRTYDPGHPPVEDSPTHVQSNSFSTDAEEWENADHPSLHKVLKSANQRQPVLKSLGTRLGYDRVRRLFIDHAEDSVGGMMRSEDLRDDLQKALKVSSNEYTPEGIEEIPPAVFKSRVGSWIADQMLEGMSGNELSERILHAFDRQTLVKDAHIVSLLREEEDLYGRVYAHDDHFSTCHDAAESISDSVDQLVVAGETCSCGTPIGKTCDLTGAEVVKSPSYREEHLKTAASKRMNDGELTRGEAKRVLSASSDDVPMKERVRQVWRSQPDYSHKSSREYSKEGYNIQDTSPQPKKVDYRKMLRFAADKANENWPRRRLASYLQDHFSPEMIKQASEHLSTILDRCPDQEVEYVDHDSTKADDDHSIVEDYELTESPTSNNPLDSMDLDKDGSDGVDIELGNKQTS